MLHKTFSLCLAILTTPLALSHAQAFPPGFTVGTDGPASPATTGYWTNHIGLNVANLTASMHFYGDILGMRHIYTVKFSKSYSETYMGFAQGGRNSSGYQTGEEMLREKNNSGGLIKLLHFAQDGNGIDPSTKRTNTFSNVGLIVPDAKVAQRRLEKHGVRIVKGVGEVDVKANGPIAKAFNIGPDSTQDPKEVEELIEGLVKFGFRDVLFVLDPDGNMVEVLEQNGL